MQLRIHVAAVRLIYFSMKALSRSAFLVLSFSKASTPNLPLSTIASLLNIRRFAEVAA
jgi:hypothetical protein